MSADTIHLPLNYHWYDETTKTVDPKRIEYRSMQTVTKDTCQLVPSKHMRDIYEKRESIKFVRFSRGYTKTIAIFAVTMIDIGPCPIPGWNDQYIRIHFTDLPKFEYPCTECSGDAHVGFTNWTGPDGQMIGEKERLCTRCANKRQVKSPLSP